MNYNENSNLIEIVHKELDFIQGCIERMAHNSFLIKGWVIAITIAFLGFMGSKKNDVDVVVSLLILFPIIILWCLDGYFLYIERCYRNLYQKRVDLRVYGITNSNIKYYDLKYNTVVNESIFKAIFSKSLMLFYFSIITTLIVIIFYIGVIK